MGYSLCKLILPMLAITGLGFLLVFEKRKGDIESDEIVFKNFEVEVDVGTITPNQKIEKKISLVNRTKLDWNFSSVIKPCSCIEISEVPKTLKKGDSVDISVSYSAPNFELDESKVIRMVLDQPGSGEISLKVKGKIRRLLSVNRSEINFGNHQKDGSLNDVLEVYNYSNSKIEDLKIKSDSSFVKIEKVAFESEKYPKDYLQKWIFSIAADLSQLKSEHYSSLIEVSSEKLNQKIIIPVRIYLISNYSIYPEKLVLRKEIDGRFVGKCSIRVNSSRLKDLEEKDIKVLAPNSCLFKISLQKKTASIYLLFIDYSPKEIQGFPIEEEVDFYITDTSNKLKLQIYISGD